MSIWRNPLEVRGKYVNLRFAHVSNCRAIHSRNVAVRNLVWIDQCDMSDSEPHELLGDRRSGASAANQTDMKITERLLDCAPKSPDVSVEKWRKVKVFRVV